MEQSMGRRLSLLGNLPKRAGEYADVAARFSAIFRDCYVYPREVYKLRKLHGGRAPRPEMEHYISTWSHSVLKSLGVSLKTSGTPASEPVLLVGNHMSYIDIPLVCAATAAVFVAKKELSSWQIIGYTCNCTAIVWVERVYGASCRDAGSAIAPAIKEKGNKVVLFPSGTTTLDENVLWKRGAFKIAHEHQLKVQPFRIRYTPLRRAAFIGKDLFVPHLWKLLTDGGVQATLEWGQPQLITDVRKDCEAMQRWTMEGLSGETTKG